MTAISFVTKLVTVMAANSQFSIAVHVLAVLAKYGDERVKSDMLAESVNTNAVVIRRLLCSLNQANLVVSQTGGGGGTMLAKKPPTISLLEIYRAVSPVEIFALHRQKPNPNCPVGKNIEAVLSRLQAEIGEVVEEKLGRQTLQDIIDSVGINCI